ncbi:helix-turn-helix transcriptional regulator [Pseudomonas syringae group genomosp. 3]|uniref:helix-turn-helix transcriptional regulator n=1 Tax=Pseudomonas syringae group genomosp. 3 TaxID=251701 RepID=UPI0011C467BE|nr:hypothetical protein [Pseudomonas syringae group genomosp. 3]
MLIDSITCQNISGETQNMKLIDSSTVTEMLGISKSTLYRWCDIKESSDDFLGSLGTTAMLSQRRTNLGVLGNRGLASNMLENMSSMLDETTGFPRPYRVGRALKWNEEEIKTWLETRRV